MSLLALAVTLGVLAATPEGPHPFTARDMQSLDRVAEHRVSPDGKWVVFTLRSVDFDANKGRTNLWLASVDGLSVRQLTTHEANDFSPVFTPDGRAVLFLSTRSGSSQVWRLPLDGGEPHQLTRLAVDVGTFAVFPDGKRLLVSAEVYPQFTGADVLEKTVKQDAEKAKTKARVYERLLFRHWDSWDEGKRNHLFVWSAEAPLVDLMRGMDQDSPTRPFGGVEDAAISMDGKEVAFSAGPGTRDAAWSTDTNIYLAAADGSSPPRVITAANKASDASPLYSPDGKVLLWLAMERPGYESDRLHVTVMDRASGTIRKAAEAFDHSPATIAFSKDSRSLLLSADNLGHQSLYSLDLSTGKAALLVEKGDNQGPQPAGARIVFSRNDLSAPADLYSANAKGADIKRITNFNADRLKNVLMGATEQFTFKGAKDDTVYAWLVKPVGLKDGQKAPVAMIIHGGPQGSMGNHFHYRWNPQALAGAGYAVLFIDFHGSSGYGQAFTDAINHDWGGAPYEDLMKGMDAALAKYPFLDGNRACALGASYGGFMINWVAGQTDRFKCLVNHDGTFDVKQHYYETEELWFPEWEFGGTPWDNPAGYAKHNPSDHVAKWKTPMLVVHGGLDFRIPDTQGMATFTALQRRGIPSKFLQFPEENHWVLKPNNSILWYDTVIAWLDQWTKAQ